MPLRISSLFICVYPWLITTASAATFTYHIAGDDGGPWPAILSSVGLTAASGGPANLVVVEGESELAQALGFEEGKKHVVVRSIVDEHAPKLEIVWQSGTDIPVFV